MTTKAGERERRMFPKEPRGAFFVAYASLISFFAYFAMYAFRKPFAAATYEGLSLFHIEGKTVFVVAQILGYTLSKYVGVRLLSQLERVSLRRWLLGCVVVAWMALLGFALLPPPLKVVAIFINGLPLGLVWGLVVRYLEGRRRSEILLAGLSASFIVASGAVKDVGRFLMSEGVDPWWMPAAVGALFMPVYVLCVTALDRLPPPSADDEALRTARVPMDARARRAFFMRFPLALTLLFALYCVLTAYRDFRDNYGVELFAALGYGDAPAIFTRTEVPVALGVMLTLGLLSLIKDRRRGLMGVVLVMTMGVGLCALSTGLRWNGAIDGVTWMILSGLGSYLAYVPYGSVLFERIVALSPHAATAVFAIYIADALGYSASIVLQLGKDLVADEMGRLAFFDRVSLYMGGGGVLLLGFALFDLLRLRK